MLYTVFFASAMNSPCAEMVDLWDVGMLEMDLPKRTIPILTRSVRSDSLLCVSLRVPPW